jgi:hypothetical protein
MAIARCEVCGKPTLNVKPPWYSVQGYRPNRPPAQRSGLRQAGLRERCVGLAQG